MTLPGLSMLLLDGMGLLSSKHWVQFCNAKGLGIATIQLVAGQCHHQCCLLPALSCGPPRKTNDAALTLHCLQYSLLG